MTGAILLLGFVTLQRLGELLLARRNTARLMARGAVEVAPGHYPLIVLLHGAWLVVLWVLGSAREIVPDWFVLYALLQVLRVWILASLGDRWTTRIIVLPGAPLVRRGPYRWLSHPNYILVCLEIAVLPLALGLPVVAIVFSALNALLLSIRIRAESDALKSLPPGDLTSS